MEGALLEHQSRHLANHEALLAYSVQEAWYRYMLYGHDGSWRRGHAARVPHTYDYQPVSQSPSLPVSQSPTQYYSVQMEPVHQTYPAPSPVAGQALLAGMHCELCSVHCAYCLARRRLGPTNHCRSSVPPFS